ncbi:MAG: hypothetical protein ACOX5J_15470 [Candidatus Hydrogenedentales bacterium]|jgi:hypothetical protein
MREAIKAAGCLCAVLSIACFSPRHALQVFAETTDSTRADGLPVRTTESQLSEDEVNIIEAFVTRALTDEMVTLHVVDNRPRSDGENRDELREVSVQCANREQPITIRYKPESGAICFYWSHTEDPESAQNIGHERALSAERAFQLTINVLRFYRLPTRLRDYCTSFMDFANVNPDLEEDLYGAKWRFQRVLSFQGVPCRGSGIDLFVPAVDGRLSHFHYIPIIEPEPCESKISQEEAITIAREWFQTVKRDAEYVDTEQVKCVIASPGFFFSPAEKPISDLESPCVSYYCWEVPYAFSASSPITNLWIRMDTGEVIGNHGRLFTSGDGFCCE